MGAAVQRWSRQSTGLGRTRRSRFRALPGSGGAAAQRRGRSAHRREPAGAAGLEGGDLLLALEGGADLVEAVQQAVADGGVDLEGGVEAVAFVNGAGLQVDGGAVAGALLGV